MLRRSMRCVIATVSFYLLVAPLSCGGVGDYDESGEEMGEAIFEVVSVPAKGTPGTLDIAEWNIEWFGSTGLGRSSKHAAGLAMCPGSAAASRHCAGTRPLSYAYRMPRFNVIRPIVQRSCR